MRVIALSLICLSVPVAASAAADLQKLAEGCARGKAKDCDKLARIARTDEDAFERARAAALITDQAVLVTIARSDGTAAVRLAAVERLTEDAVLAELAKGDGDLKVRVAAVKRLLDPAALAQLARSGDQAVREAAVESPRLADQAVLLEIALDKTLDTPAGGPLQRAAAEKLELPGLLALAKSAKPYSPLQSAAARRIKAALDGMGDADLAKVAALTVGDSSLNHLRREAVTRLGDQAVLAEVAIVDDDFLNRHEALKKVTDPGQLARIASSARTSEARVAAVERLTNADAQLYNAVLLHVIQAADWNHLGKLAAMGFPLSAESRRALRAAAAKGGGYGSYGARALLAGTRPSTWPRLRAEPYVTIRPSEGVYYVGPIPPGTYFISVAYEDPSLKSTADRFVSGDLRAGRCYVVRSGKSGSGWAPKIAEEPCPEP